MKTLLIGATGLLGHNVLRRLMDCGHEVRVLVRSRRRLLIGVPDGWVVEGDITKPSTLAKAAKGCEAVVNCAGVTDMGLTRLGDYLAVNSDLCESVVKAMEKREIGRLVHVSTVDTIGYGSAESPADESAPPREPFAGSHYGVSKRLGELTVMQAAREHPDWHVVVVNPGFMLGPMDAKPSSGRLLTAAYGKRLAVAPKGGKAFVDVRDVAWAVVSALEKGRSGARYIATNNAAQMTVAELYRLQARVMGYKQRVVTVPRWLLLPLGAVGDGLRALGVHTELSTRNIKQLTVSEHYDCGRALAELEMPQTPIEQSVRDFHAWREQEKNRKEDKRR